MIVGIIGLIMPIMPGWIFLIPGLIILSDYFAWARSLTEWAKKKASRAEQQALGKIRGREKQDGEHPDGSEARRDDSGHR